MSQCLMARKRQKELKGKIAPEHPMAGIIADAYRVFTAPKPQSTGVCQNCCMNPEVEADFYSPAIEEMPLHYIQDWYFAACDPKGIPKAIWMYLLPRVLELLAVEEDPASVGFEVTLNRFETGEAAHWSDDQWDVLDRFQRAYLDREMTGSRSYLDDTLCMFGIAGWPLDDLFAQVAAYPDDVLARRFWNDWCQGKFGIWIDAFWDNGGNTEAFAFYTSRPLYDRMVELMVAEDTPTDLATKAADVAGVMEANADWAR